ncbi:mitochondrial import inner membrane translocase subunit tim10 [Quercus suber]|uniref:Mitochondrial import inner membrane translocase subunit n=1 Tax=Quercus suber TaxID=58331 RepID=A0AAW0LDP1_QUESU
MATTEAAQIVSRSAQYKESELNMGENSCIDRCVSKYWHYWQQFEFMLLLDLKGKATPHLHPRTKELLLSYLIQTPGSNHLMLRDTFHIVSVIASAKTAAGACPITQQYSFEIDAKGDDPRKFRQSDEIFFIINYPGYQLLLSIADNSS